MAAQEPDQNIRAFYFAVALYIPYPDNISTISRLLAGPFPAVEELASRYLVSASKGGDEEIARLLDDLRYRPWVHMPWAKEEIE
jgi:hypothetical protein